MQTGYKYADRKCVLLQEQLTKKEQEWISTTLRNVLNVPDSVPVTHGSNLDLL
jgi:hypothetical protein